MTRPVVIRRSDAAVLLGCVAGLVLWLGLTDAMLRYLRASMRPWLVLAGIALGLLALATGFVAWSEQRRRAGTDQDDTSHDDSHRPATVGWLLAIPLLVAVGIAPGALGAYAVRQQTLFGPSPTRTDFDLAAHLRTHSTGGQAPTLELHQFLRAANGDHDEQRLLATTEVRLIGFVVNGRTSDSSLELARLMIGCCAGDAVGLVVTLDGYHGPALDDDTWIEVTGTFDPGATDARDPTPALRVSDIRTVSTPNQPYEYPS